MANRQPATAAVPRTNTTQPRVKDMESLSLKVDQIRPRDAVQGRGAAPRRDRRDWPVVCFPLGSTPFPMRISERPAPNFDARNGAADMLILYYTGMKSADEALMRLTSPESRVSAPYLIDEDGS